jgi:hypothetical protein
MQNAPSGSKTLQHEFHTKLKAVCTDACCGAHDVTSPYKNLVKIEELIYSLTRLRSQFFLRQVRFLKAVAMGMLLAVSFFCHAATSHRNGPSAAKPKTCVQPHPLC